MLTPPSPHPPLTLPTGQERDRLADASESVTRLRLKTSEMRNKEEAVQVRVSGA